ncbi:hypothetical protein NIES4075_65480 [Tolypothrix sp. NIES-4075]|uniref:hypothetical protein n=1 Tax=Tolypothrix sp. NIES-4075 TaxID=2005459 RepID=UPI000B5C4FFA|nr:hypothetical protein [Tolypothrix sp. NIES-4075]GAX45527.1 hypothetical protein NIES4075_65480 [Tolypothrix sp. NIES-4075]
MATKRYTTKYRKLKQVYERIIGKDISDITWYRTVSILKQHFKLEVESPNALLIVEAFADLKRKYAFSFKAADFEERWSLFKDFYEAKDTEYTCKQFLDLLANRLKIDLKEVPRSTRYYWFERAGVQYQADEYRPSKNLALVAFVAAKWAINRRTATMKSASPEVSLLLK